MPRYNNSFSTPMYREETIVDGDGRVVGVIRIKPSSVLWKPNGSHKFLSIPLQRFAEWISDPDTGARLTSS